MTAGERLIEKGRQEGLQQGAGRLLVRLLQRRFGPLSPALVARVEQATPTQLERWADQAIEASRLEDVFR